MGTKRAVKDKITRKLEENFEFLLNTKDSILNLQNTLSTDELRISMYHIKIFMKNKGYIYNKLTNKWEVLNNREKNTSDNEEFKEENIILKGDEPETIEDKENPYESMTDDLREFLKENAEEKKRNNIREIPPKFEEKRRENIEKNIVENMREKSLIPEEDIIKEIWKNTDNTSSNCELILKSIATLSRQVNEGYLLLSAKEDKPSNITSDVNSIEISSAQLMDILDGETKRYEMTLSVAFFEAIKQKFFLKYPNRASITQFKDSKILYKILIDYFVS